MNEKIEILIVKFLQNQCDVDEIATLSEWINEHPDNKSYFEQEEALWNSIELSRNTDGIDANKDWDKLSSLIEKEERKPLMKTKKQQQVFRLGALLRVAAVVLISFGLSWLAFSSYYKTALSKSEGMLEVSVAKGSKSVVKLADGTTIWLNSATTIRYPDKFKNNRRDVYIEGEAYFEVAKDKKRPFTVHTSDMDMVVLGTSFNVKSYPDEGTIETTLVEGSVRIEKKMKSGKIKYVSLKPNQQVTLIKEEGRILLTDLNEDKVEKLAVAEQQESDSLKVTTIKRKERIVVVENIDPNVFIAWKSNRLEFKDEIFESIAVKLERWYNVEISIKNEKLKKIKFTGTFENETIEQALEALRLTTRFKYKFNKNKIIIK
jgi:ferric-dicitrate binding protein FerR (iron transport regulator)